MISAFRAYPVTSACVSTCMFSADQTIDQTSASVSCDSSCVFSIEYNSILAEVDETGLPVVGDKGSAVI